MNVLKTTFLLKINRVQNLSVVLLIDFHIILATNQLRDRNHYSIELITVSEVNRKEEVIYNLPEYRSTSFLEEYPQLDHKS